MNWIQTVPAPLNWLGGSILFGTMLFFAFRFCDGFFPAHVRIEVATRLRDTRARPWSLVVIEMMDRLLVGTDAPRRWIPRFWRVTLVSFVTVVAVFLTLLISSGSARAMFGDMLEDSGGDGPFVLGVVGLLFVIFNPVVDYISAVETRLVLKAMVRSATRRWLVSMAVVDIVATVGIVLVLFPLITTLGWRLAYGTDDWLMGRLTYSEAFDLWLGHSACASLLSVYVYTTFATTVWTWLYVSAEGIFRVLPMVRKFGPVDEKPFQSIGLPVAVIGGLIWFVLIFVSAGWDAMAFCTTEGGMEHPPISDRATSD